MIDSNNTINTIFKIKFIILALLLSFVGTAQVVIASDGLNNSSSLFNLSGGSYYSGNSAGGDLPASSAFFSEGTHSRGISNGTATLTSISNINTSLYSSISMTLRLAAFSIGSSNGLDANDIVTIEVSPDGGVNWYNTLEVNGTSNAYWSYSGGIGNASAVYDGNNLPNNFSPSSGGLQTTEGYSKITVSGLPSTTSLRFRITLLNNSNNERWVVDDFKVQGVVACVPPTISSVFPNSGPIGTNVTINVSSGDLSGATAAFNGIPATVISTSPSQMIVVVPSGASTGNLIIKNSVACTVSSLFTIIKEDLTSCNGAGGSGNFSDLIITEVYDSAAQNVWHMELYNPTSFPIDLSVSNYVIERYGDIGNPMPTRSVPLSGIIPPNSIFLLNLGDSGVPCSKIYNFTEAGAGINEGDEIKLTKNGIVVDVVECPSYKGYSIQRDVNATGPKNVFSNSDWTTTLSEDCSDLGTFPYTPPTKKPPIITLQPIFSPSCTNISFTVAATEGFVGGNPLAYQWYALAPNTSSWFALTNVGVYTGTTTGTLNISSTAGLDGYQYYAQVRENTATCYSASNAVMIKSGASGGPVIAAKALAICSGTAFTVSPSNTLPDVVPTGTVYTWTAPVIVPVTAIIGGSASTTSVSNISQVLTNTTSAVATATYTVTADSGGCTSTFTIVVTVNPLPTITSTTPGSRCGTGTVTLGATASSGIINWYAASTGGSSLGTGTSFTTPSISSTTTYWVEAVDGSCVSSTRSSVQASVVSSAPLPTVAPVSYCLSSSAVALTATPLSGASLNWYGTNATGGTSSLVAPIPSTATLGNTTYYVSQTVGSCESARASIVVNVVADTGAIATYFVCDPSQVTAPNSVYFDWNHVPGRSTNDYGYSYSIGGGPLVFGRTPLTSLEVFGVLPGQSVELTILDVPGVPCYPTQSLTCSLACTTTVAPNFASIPAICSGDTSVPTLATTSPNAITGTWSPSTIDNTTSQSYVFTPDPTSFPCASKQTLNVTVNSKVTPTFTGIPSSLCQGASAPILPTTSSNSITGTWSPSSVDTSILGTTTYTFTPTTGLCAVSNSVTITINPNVTPSFSSVGPICSGTTLSALPTTSTNTITGVWSPPLNNTATTTYTFTPTTGQCATTNTLTITVNPKVTPSFAPVGPICSGDTLNALPTTSTNAITGTWSPALNNTTTTTYTFTPTAGLCANTATLIITVNQKTVPAFAPVAPICSGGTLSALPTTSTNGIIGSWSPALNTTATTTYTFTPNTGQCATTTTLGITVNPIVTPSFSAVGPICFGTTLSALPTTSTNAITGAWSPALNNTATTTYTFTPTAGQCATTNTLTITVNPKVTPSFASVAPICSGDTLNALPTTSTNAITGTWSPALNNTATTTYTFTPTAGLCATTAVVTIVVNQKAVPVFASVAPICSGSTLSALPTTSTNGITGSWSPALDNTATTSYTFTPTAGLCATTAVVTITVNQKVVPTFTAVAPICSGATLSALPTTSSNGIIGTWSPALNNTTTTTYTFTPNIGQCATTTTLTITVNPVTTPTFSSIGPLCSGTIISLPTTSINGIEGSWSPAFNPSATTTYTFTPGTGQCATTTKLTITIIALPIATATPKDSSLCSDTATSISLSSDTTGTTYLWNVVQTNVTGALAGSGDTIVQTLKTAVENKSGEAVYSITPTANGCPGLPILATVTVNPIPDVTANPSPATVCSGERTAIVLSSKVAGTTFSWTTEPLAVIGSFPDTGSTIAQTLVTNSVIPGTVDYTITPTAATCVGLPITVTVTVNPTPEVFGSGGTIICSGESTNIILSPKILGTDFTWTVVQDGVTGAEDGGGSNTIDQVLEAGTTVGTAAYTITPILNGCKGNPITIVITVNPSPKPVLEDGIICVQEATGTTYKNYLLDTGLSDSLYDFNWFKESVKISGASESTYEATAEGLYSVIATNTITSCVSQEVYATVIPNYPGLSLTTIVTDAFTPEATISVDVLGGTGPFLYRLDDGPLQSSNVFVGVSSGVHKVWVEDGQGCTNLSREVTVIDYPRYFTPNGDGFNDSWNVVGLNDQPEAKIYIFDRYGKLLKQISTIGEGWNGTFNGYELPGSDYWFTIEYLENNVTKLFKAHFSLKR